MAVGYTGPSIDQLTPSPAADKLLAEAFLHPNAWYVTSPRSDSVICLRNRVDPWMPTTNPVDALELLSDVVRAHHLYVETSFEMRRDWKQLVHHVGIHLDIHNQMPLASAVDADLCMAICRALLLFHRR